MVKNSARLMLLAATAALAITPVAASASLSKAPKPDQQVTRTQSGDNLDQRDVHSTRSIDERYSSFNPFANFNQFLLFLTFGAGF